MSYLDLVFDFEYRGRLESTSYRGQGICLTIFLPRDGGDIKGIKKVVHYVPDIVHV